MWERLQQRVKELKARDTANTQAYFIIEALKTAGHATLLGGREAEKYLHDLGMDNETIFKMKKKYKENPSFIRESLVKKILGT